MFLLFCFLFCFDLVVVGVRYENHNSTGPVVLEYFVHLFRCTISLWDCLLKDCDIMCVKENIFKKVVLQGHTFGHVHFATAQSGYQNIICMSDIANLTLNRLP